MLQLFANVYFLLFLGLMPVVCAAVWLHLEYARHKWIKSIIVYVFSLAGLGMLYIPAKQAVERERHEQEEHHKQLLSKTRTRRALVAKRLKKDPLYQILFKDFPGQKNLFVSHFVKDVERPLEKVWKQQQWELYVIMWARHLPKYARRTSDSLITKHVAGRMRLYRALLKKHPRLCYDYNQSTRHFGRVWKSVGDRIFKAHVRYVPKMILAAKKAPQPPPDPKAAKALLQTIKKMPPPRLGFKPSTLKYRGGCLESWALYARLHSLSPKQRSLLWRAYFLKWYKHIPLSYKF